MTSARTSSSASPSDRVLVFLKAPRPGTVKTRLARDLGDAEATRIYRFLVEQQLAALPAERAVEIVFSPDDAEVEMRRWLGDAYDYRAQGGGDLGARLNRAFAAAFAEGRRSVIAIGGDCPDLDAACLASAHDALARRDVVLGPAADGGYYLIGLRKMAEAFTGIPWSSPAVLATTLQRCADGGLTSTLLAEKEDIDDLASWRRFEGRRDAARAASLNSAGLPAIAVVIPALHEAARIRETVTRARAQFPGAPVIVVDGGSGDGTVERARTAGAEIVESTRGRGLQCQAGAAAAAASGAAWLLFLHADTRLPDNAGEVVTRFIARPEANAATFRLSFDATNPFLRACAWFTRFDSVFTRFGDQGILIRRSCYEALGGFPAWPLFEDVELLQRVRRKTKLHSLPASVTTSARRFERRGVFRQQWLNARLLLRYLGGASPEALAAIYRPDPAAPLPHAVKPAFGPKRVHGLPDSVV
ncbi:MAG: TIGR04283 family arsenosugar biosynthesis glycosyltransferase [Opitutus sp.]